jgi:hypothetical protein
MFNFFFKRVSNNHVLLDSYHREEKSRMKNQKRKWLTVLLMAIMSITLIFGATGCADNNNGEDKVIIDDNNTPAPANDNTDTDIDINADNNQPDTNTDTPAK